MGKCSDVIRPAIRTWVMGLALGAIVFVFFFCITSYSLSGYEALKDDFLQSSGFIRNIGLAVAAAMSFPFIVWRAFIADKAVEEQKNAVLAQSKAIDVQTEAQKTATKALENDIFIKAVEQLASDKASIRLAAIYTFGQLMDESENERFIEKIVIMLFSFMEEHSREVIKGYIRYHRKRNLDDDFNPLLFDAEVYNVDSYLSQDEQTVKTITKIFSEHLPALKNYSTVWLRNAQFEDAKLEHVRFYCTHLENSSFYKAELSDAWFRISFLYKASFQEATLHRANFFRADARMASFFNAKMQYANLSMAQLDGARFDGANLQDVRLFGAVLTNIEYNNHTNLTGAKYNTKRCIYGGASYPPTKFPKGFDPEAHGMKSVDTITEDDLP